MRMHYRPFTVPSSESKECPPWRSGALQVWQRKHSLWKWNPSALSLSTTNTRFLHAWHTSPRLWGNSLFKEGWGKKEKKKLVKIVSIKHVETYCNNNCQNYAVYIQTVFTVFHNAVCLILIFTVINEPEVIPEVHLRSKHRSNFSFYTKLY